MPAVTSLRNIAKVRLADSVDCNIKISVLWLKHGHFNIVNFGTHIYTLHKTQPSLCAASSLFSQIGSRTMHTLTDLLVVDWQEEISHAAGDKKADTDQHSQLEGEAAFGPHERPQHHHLAPYSPPGGLTLLLLIYFR